MNLIKKCFGSKYTLDSVYLDYLSHFSCPYFRNEIGGELERTIALTRRGGHVSAAMANDPSSLHTPAQARGFSLLDKFDTHWTDGFCPYSGSRGKNIIERVDAGATYYKDHFYGKGEKGFFFCQGSFFLSILRIKILTKMKRNRPHS